MRSRALPTAVAAVALGVLAGCGEKTEPPATTTPSAANCAPSRLATHTKGTLTVATDKPAYPPYFEADDPTNGKGFESAVAYAIAKQLGYSQSQVKWVVEPFGASYAPGPKSFDFDVNQISITPARATQVDFSSPYYTASQAVVALKSSPAAKATSLADLKNAEIGVQIGTTSLDAVKSEIQPSTQEKVFDNSNDVVTALKQGQVQAIVTDLPTALYITAAQVQSATVVGQFAAPGGKPDQFGALLTKNSPLTPCISLAIDDLRKSGELQQITDRWMSQAAKAPKLN
ncbi:MAG: polar amino acid transport system substrate-binding protein [Solirubrobacterales bacterium]|jgi:polar amino acid transport system substrate-binding protein|nr:polar amino acid transport system substrate-binding protein [Solirubrobacterales bacterium]